MKFKEYFDMEIKAVLLFFAAGIIVGYVSFLLNNTLASTALAVICAVVLTYVVNRRSKEKKDAKWWIGNGIFVFLVSWFVFWTIFYNVLVF